MWGFIVLLIIIVIGKFLFDSNKQNVQVAKEGGMLNKYRELVDIILDGHQNSKIHHQSSSSITLGVIQNGGSVIFTLTQTFGKVSVKWNLENPLFGKHHLEWDFPEYEDQVYMARRIDNDTKRYQENVLRANGF